MEKGETAEQAALREVFEETGAYVDKLNYIGQYYVSGKGGTIIKNVYYAYIEKLEDQPHYYETEGPVLLSRLPDSLKENKLYSFMMKDEVLPQCLKIIEEKYL